MKNGDPSLKEERPPVPWEIHYGLQAEFVKLAELLGVRVSDGMTFGEALTACHGQARAAAVKADQYDRVLSFLDGAEDALKFALLTEAGAADRDIGRASVCLGRALALLRELAGRKEA